jgi:O-acetylhomoserine/O-acetylserine sulfhydrylase-like pyridoxal-dependent enzyme
MAEELSKNFETLQLHAGKHPTTSHHHQLLTPNLNPFNTDTCFPGHTPDSATNSRAVPIYATTVSYSSR